MQPVVAVVENEERLREAVILERHGFPVLGAANAAVFRGTARDTPFQVAVLDTAVPGEDRPSRARRLRHPTPRSPAARPA